MSTNPPATTPKFCSDCGTQLHPEARFCHACASPIQGRPAGTMSGGPGSGAAASSGISKGLMWGVPGLAALALAVLTGMRIGSRGADADPAGAIPLGGGGAVRAPDISSMSPAERADRLFNRVMRLSSEGKTDSAAFFGPMALSALEALAPLDAHRRYDMGVVALVTGDPAKARAESDTILAQRPTHLLGLALAARAADARRDAVAAKSFRRRLVAAEPGERTRALPEYTDHETDIRTALELARKP